MIRSIVFALALLVSWPAHAVEWSDFDGTWQSVGPRIDIPGAQILLGQDIESWRTTARQTLRDHLDALPISPVMSGPSLVGEWQKPNYRLERYDFGFGQGPVIESLLAVPTNVDPLKPLIVALHGHGVQPWGKSPHALFDSWAGQWAEAGYVVWAPSHLWYNELAIFYTDSCASAVCDNHHIVWVKMLERIWDSIQPVLPPNSGAVVTGHSSGALSARILMAARPGEFMAGIFSAHPTLNYCRENCRHISHPEQWNVEWIQSYLVFDLLHDGPTQHQIGRFDPFAPGNMVPSSNANPGSTHSPLWETLLGQVMIRKKETDAEFHIHDGGHEYDFAAALEFVQRQ